MIKKLLMTMVLAPLMALADTWTDPDTGIEWIYTVSGGNAQIVGASPATGAIAIPSTLGGCPVASIGESAFLFCSGLTSVTIPSSVTSIGESAFEYCSRLTSVTIPASVTSIGGEAFGGTPFHDQLGDGMVILGGGVLYEFKGVCPPSVTIPEGVTSIGDDAFHGCSGLTSVTIPSSVTSIEYRAFKDCSGLMEFVVDAENPEYSSPNGLLCSQDGKTLIAGVNGNVTIPSSVTSIGDSAFYYGTGLTSISILVGVTSIGDDAFRDCSRLTSVTIPPSVTSIGGCAFYGCSGLTSVTIPEGVTSIGNEAFRNCGRLTSITIPSTVTSIGSRAFGWCFWLTSVTIPEGVTSIGDSAFYYCTGLTSVTIPEDVTSIGDSAFCYCTGLTSITIPEGVTSIRDDAFHGCSGLTSVTIPSSVTSIGKSVFENCRSLAAIDVAYDNAAYSSYDGILYNKSRSELIECPVGRSGAAMIPEGVTSIGDDAFHVCSGLTSVTIPSSVTSIVFHDGRYSGAFYGCSGLTEFKVDDGNSIYSSVDGVLYDKTKTNLLQWPAGKRGSVRISSDVTSIRNYAFAFCDGLTVVTIPPSVTRIGERAFYGCSGLTTVRVYKGEAERVKRLYDWPIAVKFVESGDSSAVYTVTFDLGEHGVRTGGGELVQEVAEGEAAVPPEVTVTGDWWFDGWTTEFLCVMSNLEVEAVYAQTRSDGGPYTEVVDGIAWAYVVREGKAQLYSIPWSTTGEITIPSTLGGCPVTSIGDFAFEECDLLTSVTIPEGVMRIGEYAFYYCYGLRSVTIPSSVTSIGGEAFGGTPFHDQLGDGMVILGGGVLYEFKGVCPPSVTIPEGVTSVGEWAFRDCSGLTSVTIPSSVTSIGEWAFEDCDELATVYVSKGDGDRVEAMYAWPSNVAFVEISVPIIEGDEGATATGDPISGFVVRPSEGKTAVEVSIPQGVDAAKVTIEVSPKVASVKPNGATVRVVNGGADITEFLNVPAADGSGVVDLTKATVKEEIVEEVLDPAKGAVIDLCSGSQGAASPTITTAPTREGLVYAFRESTTLEGFGELKPSATKVGDGEKWSPKINVKGGSAAFYSIGVGKEE